MTVMDPLWAAPVIETQPSEAGPRYDIAAATHRDTMPPNRIEGSTMFIGNTLELATTCEAYAV